MVSGTISEQQHEAGAARQAYEKALARFPDFSPAKLRLAVLSAAQENFVQKDYDWALQARVVYPRNSELAKALGILTYRKGDYPRAASLLKESSATRDIDPELCYYLGLAQHHLKDPAAKSTLQRALDLNLRPDLAAAARKLLAEIN